MNEKTNCPAAPTMPADLGVNLFPNEHGQLIVHPQPAPTPGLTPMALPRLASSHLGLWADAMHGFWLHHRRPMTMLLFLNFASANWRAVAPCQRCTRAGSSWRLNSAENPWRIGAAERLTGSLQSRHVGDPNRLVDELPIFNGLHLVSDLSTGAGGLSLWAWFRQGEEVHPAELSPLVRNQGWDWLDGALDQLQIVDEYSEDEHGEDAPF